VNAMYNRSRIGRSLLAASAACLTISLPIAFADNALTGANWPEYHGDFRAWAYSPLKQINKQNIHKLKVAWIHQPGEIAQGLESTPIVLDGVLYYSGSNNRVFALDAASGKEIWHYYEELDPIQKKSVFGFYNRGVSVGRGKVFVGSSDGHVLALDQKTGKELWKVQLTDPKTCNGCNFTSPPVLAGDVLIAGPTGGDLVQHGYVYAVNADTGAKAWTFDILKNDPASWPADSLSHGGGSAWMPGQYDAVHDVFYIGMGNPAPDFNTTERKGNNLYTSTIVALKPKTGEIVWFHQEVPNDSWDFDSPYEMVLIDKNGKHLMVHLNKGGFVSVLDRDTGKLVNVWQLAKNVNWVKGIDPKTGELIGRNEPKPGVSQTYCPSALGARSWNAGSFSPNTGLWYTNSYEICNTVTVGKQDTKTMAFSQPYYDTTAFEIDAPPGKPATDELSAYDPETGKVAWTVPYDKATLANVLATGGGLVFNGDSDGYLHAYDDANGKELWNFNAGSGLRGGIVSYSAGGKQYIVAATGFGSLFPAFASIPWPAFKDVRGGAALIAFTVE
jgi:alcohol dehydrogenase (cytochrome c)